MSSWLILVDSLKDFDNAATPHKLMTAKDYLARPQLFTGSRPQIINLSRSFAYQSRGYYCSLLAEARGHRVIPSVETIMELGSRTLYAQALPDLEDQLARSLAPEGAAAPERLLVAFGIVADRRFDRFAKTLFDWFRCPILEVTIDPGERVRIRKLAPVAINKLNETDVRFFYDSLHRHSMRKWRSLKTRTPARYSFATLYDPAEKMPPSTSRTLRHWAKVAAKLGVEVEPITRRDLARLAEFDALFIRETTSIDNHTYRFARRAVQEGMPVIDDPVSMIRCTNKIYLHELLSANGIPVLPTAIIAGAADLSRASADLGFPMVLKIPDSSFSRGVRRVENAEKMSELAKEWLADSDLILGQAYAPTSFDWRVGVLGGRPLFVVQYRMARGHWQIVKHKADGKVLEGGFTPIRIGEAPPAVIDIGVRAAQLIGDGLYGVDIKETNAGIFVVEINDNPNIEHGVEDAAEKDQVWVTLTEWFTDRIAR